MSQHAKYPILVLCFMVAVWIWPSADNSIQAAPGNADAIQSFNDKQTTPFIEGWTPTAISNNGVSGVNPVISIDPLMSAPDSGFAIHIAIPGYMNQSRQHNASPFSEISIPAWVNYRDPGRPFLPMKNVFLEIPFDVDYQVSVRNKRMSESTVATVWPSQPLFFEDDSPPPFTMNLAAYTVDAYTPKDLITEVKEVWLRNHRILQINVMPIQYNPAQGKLRIHSELDIEVAFSPAAAGSAPQDPSGLSSPAFDKVMTQGLAGAPPLDENREEPPLYMVLMADQFADNAKLAEFIDWKQRKGNRVVQVKTSDIDSSGEPSSGDITDYLRGLPDEEYPTYILILGMHYRDGGVATHYYSDAPSDLAFALRTTSDFLPDAFVGRLPADDDDELTSMLEKVMDQDRTPPTDDVYQKMVVAGQIQDNEGGSNNVADRLFCETADSIITYFENDPGGIDYDVTHAMVNPDDVDENGRWNTGSWAVLWAGASGDDRYIGSRVYDRFIGYSEATNRITDAINEGTCIVQHRDHGYTRGWADPPYNSGDVWDLNNGQNRPLVLSNNCLSGSYHKDNNFAKAWLTHSNGGAYAFIGATKVTQSGPNDWLAHGLFMGLFEDWREWHNQSTDPDWTQDLPQASIGVEGEGKRVAGMFNFGRIWLYDQFGSSNSAEFHARTYHLFGDPEAYVQLLQPIDLMVEHPEAIPPGLESEVVVKTGVEGATVCLYGPDLDIHQVQQTGPTGEATFTILPEQEGALYVTATGFGIRPYEGEIPISHTVTVLIPNGGEAWRQGLSYDISWEATFESPVRIELLRGGVVEGVLADSTDNTGAFVWDVPQDFAGGTDFAVRIICVENEVVIDESDDLFAIAENGLPEFTSEPETDGEVDKKYVYEITATDPDGDPLYIDASELPDWLSLTDNGDGTAKLKGRPESGDDGDHDVVLTLTDGFVDTPVEQAFEIDVEKDESEEEGRTGSSGCGCNAAGRSDNVRAPLVVALRSLL
ncbi:MAG: C25 family cysteine peptidase [Myxococcota bacterium]|nr:C25 family cysteine peptidase [Myxococcota bacterium]